MVGFLNALFDSVVISKKIILNITLGIVRNEFYFDNIENKIK